MKPPRFHFGLPFRAAGIWSNLETAGVTDVVGVWQHVAQLMTVVALKQRYAGHAKRAGLIAAANSYMGRLVVVVDDDVDPSNLADVMWAITTRCEPSEQIDIVRNAWSSALDPRIRRRRRRAASPRIPRRSSRPAAVCVDRQVSADLRAISRRIERSRYQMGKKLCAERLIRPRRFSPELSLVGAGYPLQFPNGFSFSRRCTASLAMLMSNTCSGFTFCSIIL